MKRAAEDPGVESAPKRVRRLIPLEEITRLIGEREAARRERNFELADQIRADLRTQGVDLLDQVRPSR